MTTSSRTIHLEAVPRASVALPSFAARCLSRLLFDLPRCLPNGAPTLGFGDPNAQPPTPIQTPTSAIFPSPVFQTPRNKQGSFEGFSSGTPRFAEEYSVFNSTPGNLRGSQGPFVDFSVPSPYPQSAGHKRHSSAENIAFEIAAHVNHFSPSPNLPLPPVCPSQRLQSSPGPLATSRSQEDRPASFDAQDRPYKKCRQEGSEESQGQTATPPPSARKGTRKLAPKLQMTTMHNEHGYPPEFVVGTPQQNPNMMPNFVTTPTDMFGYPMSAPPTAPVFWDDASMAGMDIDFHNVAANMFQNPGHRAMNSLDWRRSNEMFQETGIIPQPNQEGNNPPRRERPLAPKPMVPNPEADNQDISMYGTSFVAPIGDPFGMMNHVGGVDPGLLFTRPPSSNMEPATYDPMAQAPLMQPMSQPEPPQLPAAPPQRSDIRRVASTKEITLSKRPERAAISSPIKSTGRPGLSRSLSDNRGRKPVHRASLPALAPAARPVSQQGGSSRPPSQASRSSGRISPLKNHHRLSSLTSIPESVTPRIRTSVKFTIDSRGRARAETTSVALDSDEDKTPKAVRSRKENLSRSKNWSSEEEDDSSSDDEPIIIPSRNTSFALPDPNKPTTSNPLQFSRRSISEQSTSSLGIYYNEPSSAVMDNESEAETEVNEPAGSRGDASSELRKVVQDRQKRALNTSQRFAPPSARSSASTISPGSFTEATVPTPSTSREESIRCVCQRTESPRNSDGFMVQW
ncbi:hypothetical protein JX265_002641 [Neoarthrinium moseri]|uniref:PHD finger domain protein n=1 Tax=Neoarthrinium moseri TaxID=1658444 RepID=A0A9Q0ATP5_9PEZI|nr:hypothetical protein JX265_002641 [Neoarthrinium moseri]